MGEIIGGFFLMLLCIIGLLVFLMILAVILESFDEAYFDKHFTTKFKKWCMKKIGKGDLC